MFLILMRSKYKYLHDPLTNEKYSQIEKTTLNDNLLSERLSPLITLLYTNIFYPFAKVRVR